MHISPSDCFGSLIHLQNKLVIEINHDLKNHEIVGNNILEKETTIMYFDDHKQKKNPHRYFLVFRFKSNMCCLILRFFAIHLAIFYKTMEESKIHGCFKNIYQHMKIAFMCLELHKLLAIGYGQLDIICSIRTKMDKISIPMCIWIDEW
jgi:hypothetical protein